MTYVFCLHNLKSNRRHGSKHLIQRQVMVKDGPSASLWPFLMLSASKNWQAASKDSSWQRTDTGSAVKGTQSSELQHKHGWQAVWVCAPKAEITNPYNHTMLRPARNSQQHVWDVERCTSSSPALPMCYKKQLKLQLPRTPVKHPVSQGRLRLRNTWCFLLLFWELIPSSPPEAGNWTCLVL